MSQVTSNSSRFNLRAQVVQTLLKVQQGQSLASILNTQLNQVAERDRALFHELVLGTLRQWFALKLISLPLLSKPLNNETVETCLYVGLYQVLCTRIAAHAAISKQSMQLNNLVSLHSVVLLMQFCVEQLVKLKTLNKVYSKHMAYQVGFLNG